MACIVVTVGGVAVLAAIVAHSGTAVSAAELAPAMTLIGLGMGARFSTIYDIAIGDIDRAEAGSASGSLSSVQQLANATGAAVITTIYFGALACGPAHAMTLSLLTVIALGMPSRPAIPLLPSPRPARRRPGLTSWHRHQAAMRVPNVPPITWRESGAEQPIRGAPASTSATPSTPRLGGSGHARHVRAAMSIRQLALTADRYGSQSHR